MVFSSQGASRVVDYVVGHFFLAEFVDIIWLIHSECVHLPTEQNSRISDIALTLSNECGLSTYHGSGVRPNQHPGWVGLEWNLNAGSCISRIVNGLPDETYRDKF